MADDIDSALAAAEQTAKAGKKALDDNIKRQQADDRSFIAKSIVWAFIGLIAVVVLSVIVGVFFFKWEDLSEAAKFLMSILSSVMLPVVTLVLGHYFRKEK